MLMILPVTGCHNSKAGLVLEFSLVICANKTTPDFLPRVAATTAAGLVRGVEVRVIMPILAWLAVYRIVISPACAFPYR
ncbi:hypothetical protein C8R31_101767 [Nitrosospira sp. Nsp2]|nr:hypothetical protein C8R31_101767 [Nitrosospira sp. Nsp2]